MICEIVDVCVFVGVWRFCTVLYVKIDFGLPRMMFVDGRWLAFLLEQTTKLRNIVWLKCVVGQHGLQSMSRFVCVWLFSGNVKACPVWHVLLANEGRFPQNAGIDHYGCELLRPFQTKLPLVGWAMSTQKNHPSHKEHRKWICEKQKHQAVEWQLGQRNVCL